MSSTATMRAAMSPLARRVRAYFAPVERTTGTSASFDPGEPFDLAAPAAPWIDAGWIESFVRTPATRVQQIKAGPAGATAVQFRSQLEARVEFDFREWGKLQMAIAGGGEHFNVLAPGAAPVQPGSTATGLQLLAGDLAEFSGGDLVAVDIDYAQQTGYVGSGIAGALVQDAAQHAVDFIRRITFNVGRVLAKTAAALALAQPLLGGVPPAGAAVQKVVAFMDREGGRFFQEWSGLFVIPEESGGRVCFYYPRLQAASPGSEKTSAVADWLRGYGLHASLIAMPYHDPNDGMQVLCYRSYVPAGTAAVY